MFKTFELYLIKLFLKKIINIFLIFFALIFILGLLEEINFFKDLKVSSFLPIILSSLNVPATLFEIFPFIFLIGTQFFFLDIIDKNEIEILKINGLSNLRVLRTLFLTSFVFGFFLMTVFYTLSSKLRFIYFDIKNSHSKDDKYLAVIKESGLWIKDEIDNKILIINADKISKNLLVNVSIHEFDNEFQLINLIQSKEVDISKYEWIVSKPLIFNNNKTVQLDEEYLLETHFDIEKINSLFRNLSSLNLPQLLKLKNDYNFKLINLIQSKEVDISKYEWIVFKPLIFNNNKTMQLEEEYLIETHFDIEKINSLFSNLSSLNLSQLLKLKNDYSSLGNSTREVDIHLHKLYSVPLYLSIMTVFASIIMFNNKRNTSMVFHLILGVLFSVIIYYLSYLFSLMGENGKIPIILSIYLPFMVLILIISIGMIKLNEK